MILLKRKYALGWLHAAYGEKVKETVHSNVTFGNELSPFNIAWNRIIVL